MVSTRKIKILIPLAGMLTLSGCFENTQVPAKTSNSVAADATQATLTPADGLTSVKIIFKNHATTGSFDYAAGTYTAAAKRLFSTTGANTIVASDSSSSSWPKWLSSVSLKFSDPSGATPDCARFGTNLTADNCDLDLDGADDTNCHAPNGYFRVSEKDCNGSLGAVAGLDADPVYVKVVFDRTTSRLAAHENILAVVEYTASGIHPAPLDPSACFNAGEPDPSACADQTWYSYLRSTSATAPNPFMLMIPPSNAHLRSLYTAGGAVQFNVSGSGVMTKQFILPLATDSELTTFQISRKAGTTDFQLRDASGNLQTVCGSDSPLCVGVVLYSLSLFRI